MKDQIWALSRLNLQGNVLGKHHCQKIPSWSGVNVLWSKEEISVSQASFLPVLPFLVTEHSTVYTELKTHSKFIVNSEAIKLTNHMR